MNIVLQFVLRYIDYKKWRLIMVVSKDIDINKPLSDDEKKMLERADKMPIVYDEDSPELTLEQLTEFRRVSEIYLKVKRKL